MAPQTYKVVNTHNNETYGWKILSILLHACTPHIGDMNSDFKSDLANLVLNNREQLEDFHIRIIRLEQEINLYGENLPPIRLLPVN